MTKTTAEESNTAEFSEQLGQTSLTFQGQDAKEFVTPSIRPEDKMKDSAFLLDDTFYRVRNAKAVHWSIAWSDLMMTMFILFITLYAYQAVHQKTVLEELLVKKTPEIVGGSTADALDIPAPGKNAAMPFLPIHQGVPLITAGTIKKVEAVTGDAMTPEEEKRISRHDVLNDQAKTDAVPESEVSTLDAVPDMPPGSDLSSGRDVHQEEKATPLDVIYDLSRQALTEHHLKKFASIDLVPDTTMRIVLTGDFLFQPGKADLSQAAMQSLQKVATAIKTTPYMINVSGHTDNIPIRSDRFSTNWELSVARASRVARFLIEETGMDPNQFVVSGYSSFRPVRPNTTAENRALNRRVEIIISKRLPPAQQATSDDVKNL